MIITWSVFAPDPIVGPDMAANTKEVLLTNDTLKYLTTERRKKERREELAPAFDADIDEGSGSPPVKDPRNVIVTVKFGENHRRKFSDHAQKQVGILLQVLWSPRSTPSPNAPHWTRP